MVYIGLVMIFCIASLFIMDRCWSWPNGSRKT